MFMKMFVLLMELLLLQLYSEAVVRRCSVKKMFLEISQNSKENNFRPATLLKKSLWYRCSTCEFCENFKNTFFYGTPPVAISNLC